MHKIKVHINKPDPPLSVINKYKSFEQFIDRYKRYHTPSGIRYLFKHDIKKLVFIVIIIILLLILLLTEEGEGKTLSQYIIPVIEQYFS